MKGNRILLFVVLCLFILPQHLAEARYYDARIGRFLSVDPLAEKYPRWSPYHYSQDNPLLRVDPDGKSDLTFFRKTNVLVLYSSSGKELGRWNASNKPAAGSKDTHGIFHEGKQIEPGSYPFKDTDAPTKHGNAKEKNGTLLDSRDGPYGEHGIFHLDNFKDSEGDLHDNVGVHSGRENKGGWDYTTNGCIRTTEEAMEMITCTAKDDPLENLRVVDPAAVDSPVKEPKDAAPIFTQNEPASA
jgi:hypothetical protein